MYRKCNEKDKNMLKKVIILVGILMLIVFFVLGFMVDNILYVLGILLFDENNDVVYVGDVEV